MNCPVMNGIEVSQIKPKESMPSIWVLTDKRDGEKRYFRTEKQLKTAIREYWEWLEIRKPASERKYY